MFRGFFKTRSLIMEQDSKPGNASSGNSKDEEIYLPSLNRKKINMTADIIRRMEEEQLRKQYHISPSKEGTYL